MPYLLNLVYLLLVIVCLPHLAWAAIRKGKYRRGWGEKFWGQVPLRNGDNPCVWLHAVSVGEVKQLGVLLERIGERHPDWECVVSTTTRTGCELARRIYPDRLVFYCPLDFTWSVERALRRIRPDLLVLVELELWPNLVMSARRRGAAVAVVNARLSAHSARGYRRVGGFVGKLLKSIDLVAAQNEEYAERFRNLGAAPESVHVTGSIKFDGAETSRTNARSERLKKLIGLTSGETVFLAGSTQHPEEQLAVETFAALAGDNPQLRLLIAPRHPERFDEVARLLDGAGVAWQRRSSITNESSSACSRVLLIDTVGELGWWWGLAHIAYVGGSMGSRGGQNMIEPAAYGAAVSFGPNTSNFRDVAESLLSAGGAVRVRSGAELTEFVRRCVKDSRFATELGHAARELVKSQLGAADRTLDLLEKHAPVGAGTPAEANWRRFDQPHGDTRHDEHTIEAERNRIQGGGA